MLFVDGLYLLSHIEDTILSETKTSDWQAADHRARVSITWSIAIGIRSEMRTMCTAQAIGII